MFFITKPLCTFEQAKDIKIYVIPDISTQLATSDQISKDFDNGFRNEGIILPGWVDGDPSTHTFLKEIHLIILVFKLVVKVHSYMDLNLIRK